MDQKILQHVSNQVYRQFPEMKGIKPKSRQRSTPQPSYLLTYQTEARLANGKRMPRWVRVVVNSKGEIIKITTSH
jgi:hypothetical protein